MSENNAFSKFCQELLAPRRTLAFIYFLVFAWWHLTPKSGGRLMSSPAMVFFLVTNVPLFIILLAPTSRSKNLRRFVFFYLCAYPLFFIINLFLDIESRGCFRSPISTTKLVLRNVENTVNLFREDCGRLPQKLEELLVKPADCARWGPEPYFNHMPKDAWSEPLVYTVKGDQFELRSLGADRKVGGVGYDRDITLEDIR